MQRTLRKIPNPGREARMAQFRTAQTILAAPVSRSPNPTASSSLFRSQAVSSIQARSIEPHLVSTSSFVRPAFLVRRQARERSYFRSERIESAYTRSSFTPSVPCPKHIISPGFRTQGPSVSVCQPVSPVLCSSPVAVSSTSSVSAVLPTRVKVTATPIRGILKSAGDGRAKGRKVSFTDDTVFDWDIKNEDRSCYMLTGLFTERFVIPDFPPKSPRHSVFKVLRNRVVPCVEIPVKDRPANAKKVRESNLELPSNTALLVSAGISLLWSAIGWWKNGIW
ncbi:hypothetical protein N7495_008763 [Penicillium taxi]|uniref:uncharacterized protein n=1 Tax=Penicillium taxi TaxID=168475 RepID=UPI002544E0E0|nr:uncharacterized protein N7495_008763 [Penicillium taxi]KAJ5888722.1 hypothetical protein N7495_008763 [Penicillium taxi]